MVTHCIDCGEPLDVLPVVPLCQPCCHVAVQVLGSVDARIHQLETT